MEDYIKCPNCQSTQLTAAKKGFSGEKAVVGKLLMGDIGLLAGTIGSNETIITCLKCGHQFEPGEDYDSMVERRDYLNRKRQARASSPVFRVARILITLLAMTLIIAIISRYFSSKTTSSDKAKAVTSDSVGNR